MIIFKSKKTLQESTEPQWWDLQDPQLLFWISSYGFKEKVSVVIEGGSVYLPSQNASHLNHIYD